MRRLGVTRSIRCGKVLHCINLKSLAKTRLPIDLIIGRIRVIGGYLVFLLFFIISSVYKKKIM